MHYTVVSYSHGIYTVGQKSKLLILREHVNKSQKIWGTWTNTNIYRENASLVLSRKILYVTLVLCLNILWLKAVSEITARQTRTSLRKHDVIKVCSVEHLTRPTQIELVLPTFKSWTVHKITEYLTLELLSSQHQHSAEQHAVASSVTLAANVGSWAQTC